MDETERSEWLSRGDWACDLAMIGGATAISASCLSVVGDAIHAPSPDFVVLLFVFASAGAALIGLAIPTLLHRRICRVPLVLIVPAAMCLGELWGGGSALLASAIAGGEVLWLTTFGAIVGALVLGTFWLPYAVLRAQKKSTRVPVLGAWITSPLIGWLACFLLTG